MTNAGTGPFNTAFAGPSLRISAVVGLGVAVTVAAWAAGLTPGFGLTAEERAARARAIDAAELQIEHAAFTSGMGLREGRSFQVARGETLGLLLQRAGASGKEASEAVEGVTQIYNPRSLRPGQEVVVYVQNTGVEERINGFSFRSSPGAAITVARTHQNEFRAREVVMPVTFEIAHIATAIESSLYESAIAGGATDREVSELADIFAYDIDFQRDIFPGDPFEMVFERFHDDEGRTVRTGDLLFVSLDARGKQKAYYRFKAGGDKNPDWYGPDGKSARKFLMKTPINGARLSSGFGMRRHPILGYSKLHKGTDFAAPSGTPIMAAGDGTLAKVGVMGGYGNYVRIKHSDGYETAYAHMSRFARGIRSGGRVSQGQIIGYVGSTGRSTGPHLHYEVIYRGQQMNPMSLRVPTGRNLSGKDLEAFKARRAEIDAMRDNNAKDAAQRLEQDRHVMATATSSNAPAGLRARID
jgi:murein DD-endopeptidase MepM/ murein hydrolase activator NlpD